MAIDDYSTGFRRRNAMNLLRDALASDAELDDNRRRGQYSDVADAGQLRTEIQQGLGSKALETGAATVGHLGDILDMPGAFIRGLTGAGLSLAQGEFGRAGERLLSAFPGSEEIPKMLGGEGFRAPTGSDLLQDVGVDTGNTMDEERRIRIAMVGGLSRAEAERRFTTRYEEERLSAEQQADFASVLQQALAIDPDLKAGITTDDIKRATDATDFLGFAVEVGLDPLTYFTFGASAVGKAGKLVQAAGRAARFSKFADEGLDGARAAERMIIDGFKQADTLDDAAAFARNLEIPDTEKANLLGALQDAYKGGKPDLELGATLMEQIKRGQFRAGFKLPGMDDPVLQDGATKALELVGNGIAGIGKAAMAIRPVAEFVAKHPGMINAPRKLWLRLSGDAKKADVLGNDAMTEMFLHEQHFNRTAGYEALKYQADLKQGVVRALNGLNDAEKAEVLRSAPNLAENAVLRANIRDGLVESGASSKKVEDSLLDYADFLRLKDDELLAMQQRWGLPIQELVEGFDHVGRQFSDELLDFFAKRPDARKAWLGRQTRVEREGMAQALLDVEQGRKLKGMGFDESEAHMREVLKPLGLPDDVPVWNPDPANLLLRRSQDSLDAAKIRNLAHVAADAMGHTPDGAVDLARQIVREAAGGTADDASRRAAVAQEMLADAQAVQAEFRAGRDAVRQAGTQQAREAGKLEDAASQVAGIGTAPADLRASLKAEGTLRRMFPGAEGVADDAENAMRAMAQAVSERVSSGPTARGGSILSRDAQRRANEATEAFYAAYQGAADVAGYRQAVKDYEQALSGIVPKSMVKEYTRLADDAVKRLDQLDKAQGAVAKPVALAVNQRVRDAEKQAELAQEILSKSDVSTWSSEAKAQYVMRALQKAGIGPNRGEISALELMLKARVKLSDNLEDLAASGVKFLDEASGNEFTKYATNHYWQHLDKPGKVRQVWRAIKGVYQRSTLARIASLTRDMVGTTSQGMIAGSHGELEGALKGLGGLENWRAGTNQADDVLRLKAAGVLRTTKGEALEGRGALAGVPLLGKIEESGVVGGTMRFLGADKAGKAVGEKVGVLNEARVYYEEAWRVATYRKAIKEGLSEDDAIKQVYRHFGKFDEMTRFERNTLNDVMFFWSWMARSVPVTGHNLLAHPVKSRLALALIAGNVGNSESQPEWMRRMGGWMIGQDENGNAQTISLGNSTYFSPTMSALQSDLVKELGRGNFGRAGGELLREVARSAPPPATGLYERMTERESFTNEGWWADPRNRTGSRLRAPAGMYWLRDTALGRLLGVEVTSEPTASGMKIKQITMDPEVANLLSFIPGLEPAMTDASSFFDPRRTEGTMSPGKGLLRHAGFPMYETPVTDENTRAVREFRTALAQSIDELPGGGLTATLGNVHPNTRTERGREIRMTMDRLFADAKTRTLDDRAARAWTFDQLSMLYPEEARYLKLNERLRLYTKLTEAPEEARLKSLVR